MMALTYKLTYFDIKGLGEPIRLLLSYGNIEFEDRRVSMEEWGQLKKTMPLGQMPILEIGDKTYHQSAAISRYLAKKLHLNGDDDLEALEIDIVIDTINDFIDKIVPAHYEQDEKLREERFISLQTAIIPFYLKKLEAIPKNGHIALGKLTWADFWFLGATDYMNWICRQDVFAKNPNLRAVKENILAIPEITAWYKKSPKFDH